MKNKIRKKTDLDRRTFLRGASATVAGVTVWASGCGTDDDAAPSATSNARPEGATIEYAGPDEILADEEGTFAFRFAAGVDGLNEGATVAFGVEHGADWGLMKNSFGSREKFVGATVYCEFAAELRLIYGNLTASGNMIEVRVQRGRLNPGEWFVLTLGEPAAGGPLKAPSIAGEHWWRVFVNADGSRDENGLKHYDEIEPKVSIRVLPREAVRFDAIAKSLARPGEPVSLLVRAEDEFGNIARYEGTLDVFDDTTGAALGAVTIAQEDEGAAYAQQIALTDEGVHRLRLVDRATGAVCYSDPIEVTSDPAHEGVVWGQTHGHSLVSDGLKTADAYYAYARDRGNLDFCALTDHGYLTENVVDPRFFRHYIGPDAWEAYTAATRAAHEPGRFVTFIAYEWTSSIFSDKNVYFLSDDVPWEPYPKTLDELNARYHGRPVTIVSHMMWAAPFRRATNWNKIDPSLERVVEICSVHGAREYAFNPYFPEDEWAQENGALMAGHMAHDGLAKGHRLGIVCGADTHTGCPGSPIAGIQHCMVDGLMAMRPGALTREAIWEKWTNRRVYGTTGPRFLLDFSFDGMPMGSEVEAAPGQRTFDVTVYGKRGITKVELVGADPVNPIDAIAFDPPVWNPGSFTLTDSRTNSRETFTYVRVFQEDGHLAWSSPVFFG